MAWIGDYSWSRPTPAALIAEGCIGVMRYLGPGNGGRDITPAEMGRLHRGGLGVGLVWETTTTAALAGFRAGSTDVAAANRYADALGFPSGMPLYYAVDTDTTPAQIRGPVADTFRGAIGASKRRVRPYGEADVLNILCGELGLMDCGWQCAAWSRGALSPYRCMYQLYPPIMSGQVDKNELGPMPTDFLWHPTITFDPPVEHGDALAMTEDDLARIIRENAYPSCIAWTDTAAYECQGFIRRPLSPDAVEQAKRLGVRDIGKQGDEWWSRFTTIPSGDMPGVITAKT